MRRFTKIPNITDEKISTGHRNTNVVKGNTIFQAQRRDTES